MGSLWASVIALATDKKTVAYWMNCTKIDMYINFSEMQLAKQL